MSTKARGTRILALFFLVVLLLAGAGLVSGKMPVAYFLSVAAIPFGALVGGALAARSKGVPRLAPMSRILLNGLLAGLVASLIYDAYRVAVRHVLDIPFDPFRVQPVFGQIITGLPTTHPIALGAGWGYHLWVGMMLAMLFAALRPRGGWLFGMLFSALLQMGRWAMYPDILRAGFSDREFFANGVVGQLLWGLIMGAVVAWLWSRQNQDTRPTAKPG